MDTLLALKSTLTISLCYTHTHTHTHTHKHTHTNTHISKTVAHMYAIFHILYTGSFYITTYSKQNEEKEK